MTKRIIGVFFKTLFISLAIFSTYYFFFLKPKIELTQNRSETIKILSLHKDTLIQNRIAYITLTQLDADSANFNAEKVGAVNTLKTTRENGLSDIENNKVIPNVNKELYNRLPYLLSDLKRVYEEQNEILEAVYATESYDEGLTILKSEKAVKLLTMQTNLILEYEYWIEVLISNF